jgi:uncharacterized protein (TIGR04255 family)
LTVDFYALSTSRYTHWRNFVEDFALAHEAVDRVYQPAYSTRIGLRYVNRFAPSNTGRLVPALFDLLRPELTAQLRSEAWPDPTSLICQMGLEEGNEKLTIRTAYGQEQSEPFFLLDFDYYEEGKLRLDDLLERCSHYHDVIHAAFRWCVRDESLTLFRPMPEQETSHDNR